MVVPCQVLQQRMARFFAQPAGPGPFCRDCCVSRHSFGTPNFVARALPRGKTGSGAVVLKGQQTLRVQQRRARGQPLSNSAQVVAFCADMLGYP
ncbi:hypothetical protein DNK34_10035 [Pseudomonas dryadis]|uniref:Uncharacterized protein n=1 Tax=Phytopseudomonas dryadis TaxID=2487520 RepID=A0A4Q9R243_9GAMM|nr:hypothetical protein DNK44_10150 [Pseudomonas dryadis]TBV07149.1 hypothetical protein DNK34_10035 [Pseudomonas dryadis]TBV19457.1 hypothetical protein DNK41_02680 [Pseudomonas sp. FRB 230]